MNNAAKKNAFDDYEDLTNDADEYLKLTESNGSLAPHNRFPDSWYFACLDRELENGKIVSLRRFSKDIIVFRTESGVLSVLDAHCPHAGAHLGEGSVRGEAVVCAYHGARFDSNGEYDGKKGNLIRTCSKKSFRSYPAKNVDGLIFVYYSANNEEPKFDLPDSQSPVGEWSDLLMYQWEVSAHVELIQMETVDPSHRGFVHKGTYRYPNKENYDFIGSTINGTNKVIYPLPVIKDFETDLVVEAYGLGVRKVSFWADILNANLWFYSMPTPVDENYTKHILVTSVQRVGDFPSLPGPVRKAISNVATKALNRGFRKILAHGIGEDVVLWRDQKVIPDRLILKSYTDDFYEQFIPWARQFYPENESTEEKCA